MKKKINGEINKLVQKAIKKKDQESMLLLLKKYEGLIIKVARRYAHVTEPWTDWLQELKSQFIIFLLQFDHKKGVYFSKYMQDKLRQYAFHIVLKLGRDQRLLEKLRKKVPSRENPHKVMLDEIFAFVKERMSKKNTKMFFWYYSSGYTQKEIAIKLRLAQPTISLDLKRVRRLIKEELFEKE